MLAEERWEEFHFLYVLLFLPLLFTILSIMMMGGMSISIVFWIPPIVNSCHVDPGFLDVDPPLIRQ